MLLSSGDGAPKLQSSVPCRVRTCPLLRTVHNWWIWSPKRWHLVRTLFLTTLGGNFAPPKNILPHSPQFPADPPGPLPPPPSSLWRPPPPSGIFNKNRTPPLWRLRPPFPSSELRKNKKYPKRPPSTSALLEKFSLQPPPACYRSLSGPEGLRDSCSRPGVLQSFRSFSELLFFLRLP